MRLYTGADTSFSFDWQGLLNTDKRYRWIIEVSDGISHVSSADTFYFDLGIVTAVKDDINSLPLDIVLNQNYPNPFNPSTKIQFHLPQSSRISLTVYDIQGHKVRDLIYGYKSQGYHEIIFDGTDLASGIYFYRLQANAFSKTRRMILLK